MTLVIELLGLELHARHGVLEEERRTGQTFLVDVELEPSDEVAASTDSIEDAVDYRRVVALVQTVSDGTTFHLLEAFATAIADTVLGELAVRRVRVRVRKPDVVLALPVEHAAVVVERLVDESTRRPAPTTDASRS
jgi:7,8-dihydroneopterin aldolase/epimerase/oxygenase